MSDTKEIRDEWDTRFATQFFYYCAECRILHSRPCGPGEAPNFWNGQVGRGIEQCPSCRQFEKRHMGTGLERDGKWKPIP